MRRQMEAWPMWLRLPRLSGSVENDLRMNRFRCVLIVIADSCSGVKVVDVHDDTIVLSLDCSSVKESIVFGDKHVPTSKIGEHVVTISEAGEFVVEIFYRRELNAPASDDIRLFVYDFCCK